VDDDDDGHGQFISLTKLKEKKPLEVPPYNASCVSGEMSDDEHIKLNNNCQ
jgi:hypothetical protein